MDDELPYVRVMRDERGRFGVWFRGQPVPAACLVTARKVPGGVAFLVTVPGAYADELLEHLQVKADE